MAKALLFAASPAGCPRLLSKPQGSSRRRGSLMLSKPCALLVLHWTQLVTWPRPHLSSGKADSIALFKKGKLRRSAPARCVVHQFGEVYHLSLIAVGPRNGTEQFSAFIKCPVCQVLRSCFRDPVSVVWCLVAQSLGTLPSSGSKGVLSGPQGWGAG